jgi:hypothetical protein
MILKTLNNLYESTGYIQRKISRQFGTNILSNTDDWDIMIIADAASYEITNELATEYEYMTSVDSIWSRGSYSPEWSENTFIRDNVDTTDINYVNGNPLISANLRGKNESEMFPATEDRDIKFTNLSSVDFLNSIHPVWKNCGKHITPSALSSKALDVIESYDGRVIIHYMQPHAPFINAPDKYNHWPHKKDYPSLNMNESDYQRLITAYEDNHRYIFDSLKNLLAQLDNHYEVRLTADHGNMYGKIGGIPFAFDHPPYIWFNRNLRKVPYVTVEQSKQNKLVSQSTDGDGESVEDRLEYLGYK